MIEKVKTGVRKNLSSNPKGNISNLALTKKNTHIRKKFIKINFSFIIHKKIKSF